MQNGLKLLCQKSLAGIALGFLDPGIAAVRAPKLLAAFANARLLLADTSTAETGAIYSVLQKNPVFTDTFLHANAIDRGEA